MDSTVLMLAVFLQQFANYSKPNALLSKSTILFPLPASWLV